jgi:hypothetical protein
MDIAKLFLLHWKRDERILEDPCKETQRADGAYLKYYNIVMMD